MPPNSGMKGGAVEHRDGDDKAGEVHSEAGPLFPEGGEGGVGQRIGGPGLGEHPAQQKAHGHHNPQAAANAAKPGGNAAHQGVQVHSHHHPDDDGGGDHRKEGVHLKAHNGYKEVHHRKQENNDQ